MEPIHILKNNLEEEFWSFYVALYSQSGVEEACSCLQNKYQLNINLLLFCCWSAKKKFRPLTQSNIDTILKKITSWHNKIVETLNNLLRLIPQQSKNKKIKEVINLRDLIAKNKVFAQRIEQSFMLQTIFSLLEKKDPPGKNEKNKLNEEKKENEPDNTSQALNNIFTYIHTQHINIHKTDLEKIYRLVKKAEN